MNKRESDYDITGNLLNPDGVYVPEFPSIVEVSQERSGTNKRMLFMNPSDFKKTSGSGTPPSPSSVHSSFDLEDNLPVLKRNDSLPFDVTFFFLLFELLIFFFFICKKGCGIF